MFLAFVNRGGLTRHLPVGPVEAEDAAALLEHRAVPDGTPVLLDETTMQPIEPLCSWLRQLAVGGLDAKTLHEYGYIIRRVARFLTARGRDVTRATESDLLAYRRWRTEDAERPVGQAMWAKEAQLINQLYTWLEARHIASGSPLRFTITRRYSTIGGLRRGMDIRHLSLGQYRFFRDVGLAGQQPDACGSDQFRGRMPLRNRSAAELAVCTGMRPREWSTVLLPELDLARRRPGEGTSFEVQACAKYGRPREVFVPSGALDAVETYVLIERPQLVAAAAATLARHRDELFVIDRMNRDTATVSGLLEGRRRQFPISALTAPLRRLAVIETGERLEPLALFVGPGGRMLGASAWYRIRCEAWQRMRGHATDALAPPLPPKRWRWHDLRHTFALQLLWYLEQQMDGDEPDAVRRRRRHLAYLGGHLQHNPLRQVSRRLGHASPATTYQYLEYTDDPNMAVEGAFREWMIADQDTYAAIAQRLLDTRSDTR